MKVMTTEEKIEKLEEAFAERIMPEIHLKDKTVTVGISFTEPNVVCEDPETGKISTIHLDKIAIVYS